MGVGPAEIELESASAGEVAVTGSPWRLVAQTFAKNKLAVVGLVLIVLLFLFSFVGPLLYKSDQTVPNLLTFNQGPGSGYLLGTDQNGYDILGRLMLGGKSSLEVGLVVGIFSTVLASSTARSPVTSAASLTAC